MKRARDLLGAAVLAAALGPATAGCDSKPTEDACDRAVVNIRELTGQTHSDVGADRRAAVRSCRAQSSRDTIECYTNARSQEELFRCGGELAEAMRKSGEQKKGSASGSGSRTGSGTGQ